MSTMPVSAVAHSRMRLMARAIRLLIMQTIDSQSSALQLSTTPTAFSSATYTNSC